MSPVIAVLRRVTWAHVSLAAALALVAQSEWQLARMVGWPAWIAWAAPVALDAYVMAAVTARRDLGPSVIVSAASVFGSHALHSWASTPGNVVPWWLTGAASAVPLLVTWRVHHLTNHHQEPPCPPSTTNTVASSATAATPITGPSARTAPPAPTAPASGATPTSPAPAASPRPASPAPTAPGPASNPTPGRVWTRPEVVDQLVARGLPLPSQQQIAREWCVSDTTAARAQRDAKARLTPPAHDDVPTTAPIGA